MDAPQLCTKCGLPGDFFPRYGEANAGKKSSWCKRCHTQKSVERTRERRQTEDGFRVYERERAQNRRFRKKYGITRQVYEAMLEAQGGGCAICGGTQKTIVGSTEKLFPVDHDHTTGRVRGILCDGCNRGIGLLRDDAELLRRAAAYLEAGSKG